MIVVMAWRRKTGRLSFFLVSLETLNGNWTIGRRTHFRLNTLDLFDFSN